jgi:hypothetical protein
MALTKKYKYEMCEDVILHWWSNLFLAYAGELTRTDIDGDYCAFCQKFHCHDKKRKICPVEKYTRSDECLRTPWPDLRDDILICSYTTIKILHTARFLEFLENLCDHWIENRKVEEWQKKMMMNQ